MASLPPLAMDSAGTPPDIAPPRPADDQPIDPRPLDEPAVRGELAIVRRCGHHDQVVADAGESLPDAREHLDEEGVAEPAGTGREHEADGVGPALLELTGDRVRAVASAVRRRL